MGDLCEICGKPATRVWFGVGEYCDEHEPAPCQECEGTGYIRISLDMAIDAGDRNMAGLTHKCQSCSVSGYRR